MGWWKWIGDAGGASFGRRCGFSSWGDLKVRAVRVEGAAVLGVQSRVPRAIFGMIATPPIIVICWWGWCGWWKGHDAKLTVRVVHGGLLAD